MDWRCWHFYFLFLSYFLLGPWTRTSQAIGNIKDLTLPAHNISFRCDLYFSSKLILNFPGCRHRHRHGHRFLVDILNLNFFTLLHSMHRNNQPKDILLGIWSHLRIFVLDILLTGNCIIKFQFQLRSLWRFISQFNSNFSRSFRHQKIMGSLKGYDCFLICFYLRLNKIYFEYVCMLWLVDKF